MTVRQLLRAPPFWGILLRVGLILDLFYIRAWRIMGWFSFWCIILLCIVTAHERVLLLEGKKPRRKGK